MKTLFKVESSGREGHESEETKLHKLEEYKKLLEADGYEIVEEKELINRRGRHIEITYK